MSTSKSYYGRVRGFWGSQKTKILVLTGRPRGDNPIGSEVSVQIAPVEHEVSIHGGSNLWEFGAKLEDLPHLYHVLHKTLYPDGVLAVVREYATNAWDAHVEAGIPHVPIKVVLPTKVEPVLRIRDFGPGISAEDIPGIYVNYGCSTKRGTNEQTGFLGLGSKSAFAYSDSFIVVSHHEGMRRVYSASLHGEGQGAISLLQEGPTSETGIEIQVPVHRVDIPRFQAAAAYLFPYLHPAPNINLGVEPVDTQSSPGKLDADRGFWLAVMGIVPYKIDFSKMEDDLRAAGLWDLVTRVGGELYFQLGEITVPPSREEVSYTPQTKQAILGRLAVLFGDILRELQDILQNPESSSWEKRLAIMSWQHETKVPLPTEDAFWAHRTISLYVDDAERTGDGNIRRDQCGRVITTNPFFRIMRVESRRYFHRPKVTVSPQLRFIIRDNRKSLLGYPFTENDNIVAPYRGVSVERCRAHLDALLEQAHLEGVPLELTSQHPHAKDRHKADKGVRVRQTRDRSAWHKERYFELCKSTYSAPYSDCWAIVDHVPQADDVYVVLERFKPRGMVVSAMQEIILQGRRTLEALGGVWPRVYGIKHTGRVPLPDVLPGIPLEQWFQGELSRLLEQPHIQAARDTLTALQDLGMFTHVRTDKCDQIVSRFGLEHPLGICAARVKALHTHRASLGKSVRQALESHLGPRGVIPEIMEITKRYPLLPRAVHHLYNVRGDSEHKLWNHYIMISDHYHNTKVQP